MDNLTKPLLANSIIMELANKGLVKLSMQEYKLGDANKALHDLNEGKVKGRAVLVP